MYTKIKPLLHMTTIFILYFLTLSFSDTAFQICPTFIFLSELLYICLDIICVRILVYLYATHILKRPLSGIFIRRQPPLWQICAMGIILLTSVLVFIVTVTEGSFHKDSLPFKEQAWLCFVTVCSDGIRRAVTEEMLFRGLAAGALLQTDASPAATLTVSGIRKDASEKRSILYTALLYAAVHAISLDMEVSSGLLIFILEAFLASMVLSVITRLTGSIRTAVVIHAVYLVFSGNSALFSVGIRQEQPAVWRYVPASSGSFLSEAAGWEPRFISITAYLLLLAAVIIYDRNYDRNYDRKKVKP